MSVRLFVDHCVPNSVVLAFRNSRHEVFLLRDEIACDSDDGIVIAKAQELKSILVSLNGDFADIVVYPPSRYLGIIALQVKNHPEVIPAMMVRSLSHFAANPNMADYQGQLLLGKAHRIRIRK
jgi:predicted nuclease of predicted toxin-antitoxin system